MNKIYKILCLSLFVFLSNYALAKNTADPLPSWNNGPIKQSIIDFVGNITDTTNPQYVPPKDRIATIDNDGTLWVEQPMYTEVIFALARIKAMARYHPEWQNESPFNLVLSGDKRALSQLSAKDLEKIMAVTHSGMSVDEFNQTAKQWLSEAKNPRFKRHYTQLVYQPMLEVMRYLRDHDFTIYIVSGGGQDFIRAYSEKIYQVPIENVIGTTVKTHYIYQHNHPVLLKTAEILFINDKTGKPQDIDLFIGKKPIIAFGNSDGDREMLEWTQSHKGQHLMLLVHHDDAKREYAYGPESKVGTFSDLLMTEALNKHWSIISMQHDWKTIFPSI